MNCYIFTQKNTTPKRVFTARTHTHLFLDSPTNDYSEQHIHSIARTADYCSLPGGRASSVPSLPQPPSLSAAMLDTTLNRRRRCCCCYCGRRRLHRGIESAGAATTVVPAAREHFLHVSLTSNHRRFPPTSLLSRPAPRPSPPWNSVVTHDSGSQNTRGLTRNPQLAATRAHLHVLGFRYGNGRINYKFEFISSIIRPKPLLLNMHWMKTPKSF